MPTVVQSLGGLVDLQPDWMPRATYGSLSLYADYTADYWTIYRTQPNVRTVVDFLARNIAQLGLHVYRRASDTDRERLADHGLAQAIKRPNPFTSRYRLIESLVIDMGIYFNAYWLKLRPAAGQVALVRVPPPYMCVEGNIFAPTGYTVDVAGRRKPVDPADIVHFRGHGEVTGLSPLETLRRILAEEAASGEYREGLWRHGARMSGVINRPLEAPEMSPAAQERYLAMFEAMYASSVNSGKTALLDEGMTFSKITWNAEETQYLETRKLTREEVARAYHVPLPMVGILDHATYSNVGEMHKMLYQDTLGPWLVMLEEEIELQLLPEFADTDQVYVEFNIAEKLKGSFEEQAAAISTTVGRPILTTNEGRALLNRNALPGDADQLVTPLNVLVGGQASPTDSAPPKALSRGAKAVDATHIRTRERHVAKWTEVLVKFFERQAKAVQSKLPAKATVGITELFDLARWNKELAADLLALNTATATVFAQKVADDFDIEVDMDQLSAWLKENARIAAEGINTFTRSSLVAALAEDDPKPAISNVFEVATGSRAEQIAQSKVTTIANFGAHEGAKQSGAKTKTWRVNSGNPRSQHRALGGATVKLKENFSNGMAWPGDFRGGADQLANCQCSLSFGGQE